MRAQADAVRLADAKALSDSLGEDGTSLFPAALRAELTPEQLDGAERTDRMWNFTPQLLDQLLEEMPQLQVEIVKSLQTAR